MIGPQFFRDLDILELRQVDGADVEPVVVSKFNLHAGARADVVVCADQEPGNFRMSATSAAPSWNALRSGRWSRRAWSSCKKTRDPRKRVQYHNAVTHFSGSRQGCAR